MKKRIIKTLALLLSLCMCIGLMPLSAFAIRAKNKGPNPSATTLDDHSYIHIMNDKTSNSGSAIYCLYKGHPSATVDGVSYNADTNTLTLNNYNGANKFIETNQMGDDFKIELIGANAIGSIQLYGFGWGCGLSFTGSGSLTVNEGKEYDIGIALFGEGAEPHLDFGSTATVNVYCDGEYGATVALFECSLDTENIKYSGITEGCKIVEYRPIMYAPVTSGTYTEQMPIYIKDGAYYTSMTIFSGLPPQTVTSTVKIFSISGTPEEGFIRGELIEEISGGTIAPDIPDEYVPIPDNFRKLKIGNENDFESAEFVSFFPSGGSPIIPDFNLTITTKSLPEAFRGKAYNAALSSNAENANNVTWALASDSSLPKGLSLSSEGKISGTPTELGDNIFTVVATLDGKSTERQLNISVKESLNITSSDEAVLICGSFISHVLTSNMKDTSWRVAEGKLPEWLKLYPSTGELWGLVPENAQSLSLTVEASANGQKTQQNKLNGFG